MLSRNIAVLLIAMASTGCAQVESTSEDASPEENVAESDWGAQGGTNYCVTQAYGVRSSPNMNANVVGWMPYSGVWHHYSTSGNWSLGYVRGNSVIAGYIPKGILSQDLGNGSNDTKCPYH